jgi:hypothetical protein
MSTSTTADEVDRRQRGYRKTPKSLTESLLQATRDALLDIEGASWSFDGYSADPVGFAVDVLGAVILPKDYEPTDEELFAWHREKRLILWWRQIEVIEAVRDNLRVAVASGHKVSKSTTAAILALWFYCCFDEARVVLSSKTARQVDGILWREVKKLFRRARKPIPGKLFNLARTGLKSEDFREIVGFTAEESEAIAGVSGANVLYLLDEASGIEDEIFEAFEGNRAAEGTRMVLFGNPTRVDGEHCRAFHEKKKIQLEDGTVRGFYKCITISSEETPNAVSGRNIIPGLAGRDWINEKREEWGIDSALYWIRVLGKHAINAEGKIISIALLTEAQGRWHELAGEGPLHIGVDPAGPGGQGDLSGFAWRRGKKVLGLRGRIGLTAEGHLAEVLGIIDEQRKSQPTEYGKPSVVIDRDGPEGAKVYGVFLSHVHQKGTFTLIGVRGGERAHRSPMVYERVRDEVWANVAEFLKTGGVPDDPNLSEELKCPEWIGTVNERLRATPKTDMRRSLDRSPDRADAVCLSVWEKVDFVERIREQQKQAARSAPAPRKPALDAYGGLDAFRPKQR